MANYYTPTVVRPTLVAEEMSSLTRYLLETIFDSDEVDGKLYFHSKMGPESTIEVDGEKLCRLIKESSEEENGIERLYEIPVGTLCTGDIEDVFEIPVDANFIDQLLQDVIRRSSTIPRIEVIWSHMCDSMRPDGFGGAARIITKDKVSSFSTHEFLQS